MGVSRDRGGKERLGTQSLAPSAGCLGGCPKWEFSPPHSSPNHLGWQKWRRRRSHRGQRSRVKKRNPSPSSRRPWSSSAGSRGNQRRHPQPQWCSWASCEQRLTGKAPGTCPWPLGQLHPPSPPPLRSTGPASALSNRLRDVLAEKERECQALVQQALQRVNGEAGTCALAPEPPGEWDLAGEHSRPVRDGFCREVPLH